MGNHSKQFSVYYNRMISFRADLELVDIMNRAIPDEQTLFNSIDNKRHTLLSDWEKNDTNRLKLVNHLKGTIYSSFIKDIYEEVTAYLKSILYEAVENSKIVPEILLEGIRTNKSKIEVAVEDILRSNSLNELKENIVDQVFRKLEEKQSTAVLIEEICKKLGITIEENVLKTALEYLDIRHKFVHSDGLADQAFINNNPDIKVDKDWYIELDFIIVKKAYNTITKFIEQLDDKLIEAGYLKAV